MKCPVCSVEINKDDIYIPVVFKGKPIYVHHFSKKKYELFCKECESEGITPNDKLLGWIIEYKLLKFMRNYTNEAAK